MSRAATQRRRGLHRLSLHPALVQARHRARLWRDERLDWQLIQLWRASFRISTHKADVLSLGESSLLFVSPTDTDKRRLPAMVRDELNRVSMATLCGAGYDPRLYCHFIGLLSKAKRRPTVVLLSICVRTSMSTHVQLNPRFSYARSREVMTRLDSPRAPLADLIASRSFDQGACHFEDAWIETRWDAPRTVGHFRRRLRGAGTSRDQDTERVLFNYFHGESVSAQSPGLAKWAELGRVLRDFGVPVIAYQAPIPLRRGELHFPGEFIEHVRVNERLVEASLAAEVGGLLELVPLPLLDDEDFVDAGDATEHLAESGRLKVARIIGPAVRAALEARRSSDWPY